MRALPDERPYSCGQPCVGLGRGRREKIGGAASCRPRGGGGGVIELSGVPSQSHEGPRDIQFPSTSPPRLELGVRQLVLTMSQRPAKASKQVQETPRDELSEGSSSESEGGLAGDTKGKGKKKLPKRSSKACKFENSMTYCNAWCVADLLWVAQVTSEFELAGWVGSGVVDRAARPRSRWSGSRTRAGQLGGCNLTRYAADRLVLSTAAASLNAGVCATRTGTDRRQLYATIGKQPPLDQPSLAPPRPKQPLTRPAQRPDRSRMHKSGCNKEAVSDQPGRARMRPRLIGPPESSGPPKGYIEAIESRLHRMEALLGGLLQSDDPRAAHLLTELIGQYFGRVGTGRGLLGCS